MVTEIKQEIINKYLQGLGIWSLRKQYNVTATTVKNILKENEVRIRGYDEYNYRRFTLDETCLDQIDSELKAYFLGFFFADGCNYYETEHKNNLNRVMLRIQDSDINILNVFASDLYKTNKPITVINRNKQNPKWQDIVCLEIQSKRISKALNDYGAVSNKSLILQFPTCVPEDLMNHFMRGYFDGDGFISDYEPKPGGRPRFSVIGNKEFMEGFQKTLIKSTGLKENKLMLKPNTPSLRILEYGGTNVVKTIREYLYNNATIYLDRKKQRFDKIS